MQALKEPGVLPMVTSTCAAKKGLASRAENHGAVA